MIENFTIVKYLDYPEAVPTIIVEVDFDGKTERIVIPLEAIASRRLTYGLDSNKKALEAILLEHYTRIYGGAEWPKHTDGRSKHFWKEMNVGERGAATGALRKDIKIAPIKANI